MLFCAKGAPEADALLRAGLSEGSPNTHPGQGTACRRFFFDNAYLELLWVDDAEEAQGDLVIRTGLWTRWSQRTTGACPFSFVLRPGDDHVGPLPFETWAYRPSYLPEGLSIDIAIDTPISEPAFFYLAFQRGRRSTRPQLRTHALPVTTLTNVTAAMPPPLPQSAAATFAAATGLVTFETGEDYVLHLTFDHHSEDPDSHGVADFRPTLPLIISW
jgi:hypothetical protein